MVKNFEFWLPVWGGTPIVVAYLHIFSNFIFRLYILSILKISYV